MARKKSSTKKQRLAKAARQRKWAPFWTVPRIYGKTRRVHPGRHTSVKRSWRYQRIKA